MEDRTVADWMGTSDSIQQSAILDNITARIDLAVLTIPELFRDLQPYLSNEDVPLPEIAQALSLFAGVLDRLRLPLDRIDVHEFTTYFCQRLENEHDINSFRAGVKECAQILSSLAKMEHQRFPARSAKLVAQSVFAFNKKSTLKDQKAATRLALLELMRTLIRLYKSNLVTTVDSKEFVEGIVSMAEFEKDPSCLNVLFPIYETLSKEWDGSEDVLVLIWDSFIRYYPIKLSGRIASVPTPDELRQLLLNCFISNDSYAKYAFPRLIELLDTNQDLSANVKNDVFVTMAACVSGYSISEVLKWAPKIWDSLKFEVWNGENDEFIRGALNVIHAMIGAMGHPTSAWDDVENQYAKCLLTILTECSTRLIDSRQRYMEATGSILYAIASASPYALSWVARKLLPVMFTLWQEFTSESDKTSLLTALNSILQSRLLVEEELDVALAKGAHAPPGEQGLLTSVTQTKSLLASSLVDYQRNLIDDIYFSAMTENISNSPDGTRYRAVTIKGLVLLMSIQNLLSDFEKGTIIESLNSILLKPNQIDTLSKEAVLALQKVSSGDPAKFQKITLTNFMSRLPKSISADRTQRKSELDSVIYLLDSLAKIACTATCDAGANQGNIETNPKDRVFLALQKALVAKLTDIIGHDGQLAYGNIILGAICQGIIWYEDTLTKESKSSSPPEYSARNPTYHPFAWIPLELCQRILMIKQPEAGMPYIGLRFSIVEDERTVDKFISLIGNISTLALRSSQTTAMNNFLNSPNANSPNSCSQVWSVFIENTPGDIDTTQQDLVDGPAEKCLVNALSMSLVAGVRREDKSRLKIDVGNAALAMIKNATSIKNECSPFARVSMLHFLQLLVNKFGASEEKFGDRTLVQVIVDLIESCDTNSNEVEVERYYQALSYFTAASLACCDKSSELLIGLMVKGLKHPKLGRKVARSFRILLAPSRIMSKENFCILRPLRHGRLFQFGIEEIKNLWREFSFTRGEDSNAINIKTNCLIALAGGLAYMDEKVYLGNINEILPLILEGTNIQNDDFSKLSCISIIRSVVPACPDIVETHLDSVINRMTDRTHNTYYSPSDANAACRVAALDVLSLLPRYVGSTAMLKRKSKIMSELDTALNDVSMEVRLKAQKCKMEYFNLDE